MCRRHHQRGHGRKRPIVCRAWKDGWCEFDENSAGTDVCLIWYAVVLARVWHFLSTCRAVKGDAAASALLRRGRSLSPGVSCSGKEGTVTTPAAQAVQPKTKPVDAAPTQSAIDFEKGCILDGPGRRRSRTTCHHGGRPLSRYLRRPRPESSRAIVSAELEKISARRGAPDAVRDGRRRSRASRWHAARLGMPGDPNANAHANFVGTERP